MTEEAMMASLREGLSGSRRSHVILVGDLLGVPDPIRSRQSLRALDLEENDWNVLFELRDRIRSIRKSKGLPNLRYCKTIGEVVDAIWGNGGEK